MSNSKIRIRFQINPGDDRLDNLRMELLNCGNKKEQTQFIYDSLVKGTMIFSHTKNPEHQDFRPVMVELNLSQRSYGLRHLYNQLSNMEDHRTRAIWLRRHLMLLSLTQHQTQNQQPPLGRIWTNPDVDSPNPGEQVQIASPQQSITVPDELRAMNSKALEMFNR